jgi:hypothetical protein
MGSEILDTGFLRLRVLTVVFPATSSPPIRWALPRPASHLEEKTMPHPEVVQLQFRPHDQTDKHVMEALKYLLGRVGCPACGRIAFLNVGAIQERGIDKALGQLGVVGIQELGPVGH